MVLPGCGGGSHGTPRAFEADTTVRLTPSVEDAFGRLRDQLSRADAIPERLRDDVRTLQRMLDSALGSDSISVVDMFRMQLLMNKLSQLSEMSGAMMSASNSAIMSLARNIKG